MKGESGFAAQVLQPEYYKSKNEYYSESDKADLGQLTGPRLYVYAVAAENDASKYSCS